MLLLLFSGMAQVRHVRGINAVESGIGLSRFGWLAYGSYIYYFNKQLYLKSTLFYEQIKMTEEKIPVSSIGVDVLPAYTVSHIPGKFYLNAVGGCSVILYEYSNNKKSILLSKIDKVKFGLMGGAEAEYYLSGRCSIIGNLVQRYYISSYGSFRLHFTLGMRYSFF